MEKAKFIGDTHSSMSLHLNRWECPICRKNPNQPECRFNLSDKKIGKTHKCRFCKTELLIEK